MSHARITTLRHFVFKLSPLLDIFFLFSVNSSVAVGKILMILGRIIEQVMVACHKQE